jgi:membrane protein
MGKADAFDSFQRRHLWAGFPLAVVYKYADDQGNYLAALITFYGFLSLFPLLLLLVTVLGYVLHGNPDLQQQVLSSAVAQFPVIGDQLASNIHSLHGSVLALIVGVLGSLYGGLGVAQAVQSAMNKIWGVPRAARPNAIKARGISLLLLLVIGGGILLTTVLSALSTSAQAYGANLGAGSRILTTVAAVVVNALLFIFAFRVLTAREISTRQVRAGAIAAAIIWQLLQVIGTYAVGHSLKGASATYGVFGLVLGLIAWIYLGAVTFVLCAEANVVRANKFWPRSLLTPFTDDVQLTAGDRRAYTSYPATEQHKGFQNVDVDFDLPTAQEPPYPSAEP